jgi:hypothetical protein
MEALITITVVSIVLAAGYGVASLVMYLFPQIQNSF